LCSKILKLKEPGNMLFYERLRCKNNFVEPQAYLKDVFSNLAQQPGIDELTSLLPNIWLKSNPNHRWEIAHKRKAERKE